MLHSITFQGALPMAIPHSENCSYLTSLLFLWQLSMEKVWWFVWKLFENLCAVDELNCLFPPAHWLCNSGQFVTGIAAFVASSSSKDVISLWRMYSISWNDFFPELHLRVCRDPCGAVTDILKGIFENMGMMCWCCEARNDKQMGCRDQELLTSKQCVCVRQK